jgi:hypothetical protein
VRAFRLNRAPKICAHVDGLRGVLFYDQYSNRTDVEHNLGGNITYSYDNDNRLTLASISTKSAMAGAADVAAPAC